ncbi:MAG: M1 family metallopeptidase, partial [Alicyclobacillus sp.]|nr:M1 family metallopeptidase [Alicyclobacillus sp.]
SKLLAGHPGDGAVRGPDQLVNDITAHLDPARHTVKGALSLHLRNNLGRPLTSLYFNVWSNAPHYRRAGGTTQVTQVAFDGQPAAFALRGTVLTVKLTRALPAGAYGTVAMNFQCVLPHIPDRYGWDGTTVNLGNWFPILAVHDAYGWITPPFYTDGESFYSLTGAFHLTVDAPKNLVLAISGEPVAPPAGEGDRVVYRYRALGVRDVAMVGDTRFRVIQGQAGGTTVYTYYTADEAAQANLMLTVAQQALLSYSQHYGPYPYRTLRVCAMKGWFGGMEYPQLVMISFQGQNSPADTRADVAHEVAHQWFYGLVGDDEYLTPWVDESFATFAEERFDHQLVGLQQLGSVQDHVSDPVSAFPNSDFPAQSGDGDSSRYYDAVYEKGAAVLDDLMQMLGEARFDAMIRTYVNQYEYRVATTDDFIRAASAAAGHDLTSYFRDRGVQAEDALSAPRMPWVDVETKENGCDWHILP